MLVSVFTPTHDPTRLQQCFDCLKEQTYPNWEWVVVPNGKRRHDIEKLVQSFVAADSRVKCYTTPEKKLGIGALKRMACLKCEGELFVEYDHDDRLTKNALEDVAATYKKRYFGQPIFIWSDGPALEEDGTCRSFSAYWGWKQRNWVYRGKTYEINVHHEIGPRSLCEILYCPNHVRVWNRKAYELSGGHNADLKWCDDHELMIKTYLCGAEFIQLENPVYLQQLRRDNTSIPNASKIQELSRKHRDVYLRELVHEWCRRLDLTKYDLGGAHNCPEGYVPIDPNLKPGTVPGISKSVFEIDFKPNSVGVFRAQDFLEHIPSPQLPALFNKLYDALVPGGWILTDTPAAEDMDGRFGRGAVQDPTHVSLWTTNNTWYYSDRNFARFVPEIRCRFQNVVLGTYFPSEFHVTHRIPYMRWDACALKDENAYWPGEKKI